MKPFIAKSIPLSVMALSAILPGCGGSDAASPLELGQANAVPSFVKGNISNKTYDGNPALVPGEHDVFVSGDNVAAKAKVIELLHSFGWKQPIDLGDLSTARGSEQLLPIWLRLWGKFGTPQFNFKLGIAI